METEGNRLKNSSSPYLLQHANNPVDWYPWGKEAFEKAKSEDMPILLSIGYSSCHWCHVMEKESFENDSIAEVMNKNFVSIKVDREERPDVDQIYMDAVQAMGMNGGWPLNVFLTPDLKPFYGGTYFPPQQWVQVLNRIADVYKNQNDKVVKSAEELGDMLAASEINKYNLAISTNEIEVANLEQSYEQLQTQFDSIDGGLAKAPKFPMPSIWQFLMRYATHTGNEQALDHLQFTLDKIALGGIHDQIGGGFARYSVDKEWLVPHFEKMLYDNGQLMSLYADAYRLTDEPLYKDVIYKTYRWLTEEMLDKNGGFYSALDADSEGEEGKFYVFTEQEVRDVLPEDLAELAIDYYNITPQGNWEDEKNIFHADVPPVVYSEKKGNEDFNQALKEINDKLLKEREKRIRPGLDNKIITSWNALMNIGLTNAFKATGDEKFLNLAEKNMSFLLENVVEDGAVMRTYSEKEPISGYLDDYSFMVEALINLYEVTFNKDYLDKAHHLTKQTLERFYDDKENMFFYTEASSDLIARKKEIFDNVIPSSNSVTATNLYKLGLYYDDENYKDIAGKMLKRTADLIPKEPVYLSNWAILYYQMSMPTAEVVIIGNNLSDTHEELLKAYHPNMILMGGKEGDLPLMENKTMKGGETTIYVCYNKTCKLPVTSVKDALKQLKISN